jgi:hypothetical protein
MDSKFRMHTHEAVTTLKQGGGERYDCNSQNSVGGERENTEIVN